MLSIRGLSIVILGKIASRVARKSGGCFSDFFSVLVDDGRWKSQAINTAFLLREISK